MFWFYFAYADNDTLIPVYIHKADDIQLMIQVKLKQQENWKKQEKLFKNDKMG